MWLDNLKELKKAKGMSAKQIADKTNLPERTVNRVFSGDTENPTVVTLHRIVSVLGGSLDDILADSNAVVGSKTLSKAEEEIKVLFDELEAIKASCAVFEAENATLKTTVDVLTTERDTLLAEVAIQQAKIDSQRNQIDTLKDQIIETHSYYIKRASN